MHVQHHEWNTVYNTILEKSWIKVKHDLKEDTM